MKKILFLFMAFFSALSLTACNKKSDWKYIESKKEMIIGYTLFEPIAYFDGGTLTGFDVELAKEVGKELNIDVKFQKIEWTQKEFELKSKTIDLVWNGLTVTEERKETMEFTVSYLANNQVAVIRKADAAKYTKTSEIFAEGVKLCAESGSAGADVIEANNITNYTKSVDMVTCLTELNAKTSDVAVMDSVMAKYYMNTNNDLMVIENLILMEEEYGIAGRKGDTEFIGKINDALKKLKENGKINELALKYGLQDDIIIE